MVYELPKMINITICGRIGLLTLQIFESILKKLHIMSQIPKLHDMNVYFHFLLLNIKY